MREKYLLNILYLILINVINYIWKKKKKNVTTKLFQKIKMESIYFYFYIFTWNFQFYKIWNFKSIKILMFLFYLRGKSRRGDGSHVLGAQVLRGVGEVIRASAP